MGIWDKIKRSISPGDDDDNTYDDEEFFEGDYDINEGYGDGGMMSNNVSGGYNPPNAMYAPPVAPNHNNTYQPPANNNVSAPPPTTAVTSITAGDLASSLEIIIVKPEVVMDGQKIADFLMSGKTVSIDFEETNKEVIRKLLDFTTGVLYAINGNIKRVQERNYIASPSVMRVVHDPKKAERDRGENIGREPSIY